MASQYPECIDVSSIQLISQKVSRTFDESLTMPASWERNPRNSLRTRGLSSFFWSLKGKQVPKNPHVFRRYQLVSLAGQQENGCGDRYLVHFGSRFPALMTQEGEWT